MRDMAIMVPSPPSTSTRSTFAASFSASTSATVHAVSFAIAARSISGPPTKVRLRSANPLTSSQMVFRASGWCGLRTTPMRLMEVVIADVAIGFELIGNALENVRHGNCKRNSRQRSVVLRVFLVKRKKLQVAIGSANRRFDNFLHHET